MLSPVLPLALHICDMGTNGPFVTWHICDIGMTLSGQRGLFGSRRAGFSPVLTAAILSICCWPAALLPPAQYGGKDPFACCCLRHDWDVLGLHVSSLGVRKSRAGASAIRKQRYKLSQGLFAGRGE